MRHTNLRLLAAGILMSGLAWAQDAEDPGRGVARISLINGDVSVRRGDSGDWVAAAVNAPLVAYDNVLTGTGSRAEVQFDYANFLRMSSDTEVRLSELENRRYQVQVARGTVTFRVLRDTDADVELDTPNVSLRPVKKGVYRITVTEDGTSEITVRSGEAEAFTPKGVERVHSGRTMLVRGTQSDPEFQVLHEVAYDNWDRWNEDRDRQLERSRAYEYVSRDIYGADDLDSYGRWINMPPYGWVWSPGGVAPGWAPYRNGRWAWVDYYGWSWVSYDPWGWAPYHYGRWFNSGPYGWCWFAGPRYQRHYWSPALVAFFGFGHGVNVGVGFGNIGWVPLAPYEPFYPWYGRRWYGGYRNSTYVDNRVTIINNTNITSVYRNARVANGVTGLDAGAFTRGGRGEVVRVSEVAQRAALMRGPIPVAPVSESLRLSDRRATVSPSRTADQVRFYTRRPPAVVERIPFEDQRRGMQRYAEAMGGRPAQGGAAAVPSRGEAMRPGQAGSVVTLPAPGQRQVGQGGAAASTGWRRVQEAPASRPDAPAVQRGSQNQGEWRRFGGSQASPSENAPARREQVQPPPRTERATPAPRSESQTNGQRFGASRGESEAAPARTNFRSEPRSESPAYQAPRSDRSESIRINPPIVRERSEPRSAPRSEAPSRVERSAPAAAPSRSSGGGGGSRSSEASGGARSRR